MNKRLLELYALAVCFVSIGCLSIFVGIFLYNVVELSFPTLMESSNTYYPPQLIAKGDVRAARVYPGRPLAEGAQSDVLINGVERKEQFQKEQKIFKQQQLERMKTESIKSIIRSIIVSLIASLVFYVHWRIAKQARTAKVTPDQQENQ